MIGSRLAQEVDDRPARAGLGVVGAVHDAGDARVDDRARAHRAGFQRHEEFAAGKAVVAHGMGGLAQRGDFRVGCGIVGGDGRIAATSDDDAILDDDGANRHFAARACLTCQH